MRIRIALALLPLAGCETFFPLEFEETVTGTITALRATNNPDGTPNVATVIPTVEATVLGVEEDIVLELSETDGSFQFARTDDRYRLSLAFEDGAQLEIQASSSQILFQLPQAGRDLATSERLTESARIVVPASTNGRLLVSTGQWGAVVPTSSNDADWAAATPTGGRAIGRLDGTQQGDRLYYLELGTGISGDQQILKVHEVVPADMPENVDPVITVPAPAAVIPNGCVPVDPGLEGANLRVLQAMPESPDMQVVISLAVSAVPDPRLGFAGSFALAGFNSGVDLAATADIDFHDPFPGYRHAAVINVVHPRTVTLPGMTGTIVGNGQLLVFSEAMSAASCSATATTSLSISQAIPNGFELAGTRLDSDNALVPLFDTPLQTFTWELDAGGPVDLFDVRLFEVFAVGTATAIAERRHYVTTEPRIDIVTEDLVRGRTYLLQVASTVGTPEAATGDFVTQEFPFGSATISTPVFIPE
jgi:hypothetical protein